MECKYFLLFSNNEASWFFLYGRPIVHILMKLMVDTMKNTRIMVLTYGSLNAEFAHELLHI